MGLSVVAKKRNGEKAKFSGRIMEKKEAVRGTPLLWEPASIQHSVVGG